MKSERRRLEKGSGLVEFAISLVVVLTVLFGIIDTGRALYAYNWCSNSARLGTRFMMVRGTKCTLLSGGCPATGTDATNYIESNAVGIDTGQVTVTTWCWADTVKNNPPCPPQALVQVQVQYNFKFVTPFVPLSGWTMQSTSERVVQN